MGTTQEELDKSAARDLFDLALGLPNHIQDVRRHEQSLHLASLPTNHAPAILSQRHLFPLDDYWPFRYCDYHCWCLSMHVSELTRSLVRVQISTDTCNSPVNKAWQKHIPGHCYNLVDAWYSNAVFSITTDILILLLPIHMVYKLQRAKREKLLLLCVFIMGSLYVQSSLSQQTLIRNSKLTSLNSVTVTSVIRFVYLKSATNPDTTCTFNQFNFLLTSTSFNPYLLLP